MLNLSDLGLSQSVVEAGQALGQAIVKDYEARGVSREDLVRMFADQLGVNVVQVDDEPVIHGDDGDDEEEILPEEQVRQFARILRRLARG